MDKPQIYSKLTAIFHEVFNSQNIVLSEELTANDVDNWDSLTHMILISEVEKEFGITFKLKELNRMKNVGAMVEIMAEKL